MSHQKRGRMGPESDEYNRLKGQRIRIWPQGAATVADTWTGKLVWVDIYTLGVALDPFDVTNVSIVYKAGIRVERVGIAAPDSDGVKRDTPNGDTITG